MADAGPPSDAGDDTLVGTVLAGRYRIVRRLGEGAMGTVYLGEHLKFGRLDAIKVLRDSMAQDREAAERFLRGARNASAIKHQNVCTVYDFSDAEGGFQFLAMEYVEGDTLADVLEREGPMAPGRALALARQVAEALAAAHDLGIVHRDLKPGNVMLGRRHDGLEQVKVVDFDIAKGTAEGEGHEVTRMGFVVGTPEYMSPEQLIGDPLDGRSDLYSLGIMLFRMLTGLLPSRATNTQDLMVERLTRDPLALAETAPERTFPDAVQPFLDRLLQRKRDDRFASAREVATALERFDGSAPPPTRVASAEQVGGSGARAGRGLAAADPDRPVTGGHGRQRMMAMGVAGIVGVAVLGTIGYLGLRDGPGTTDVAQSRTTPERDGGDAIADTGGGIRNDDPPDTLGDEREVIDDRAPDSVRDMTLDSAVRALTPATADELLHRQFDSLVVGTGPARLAAAADSARLVWDHGRLGSAPRAFAAYLLGSVRAELGDTLEAVRWLRRAVELAPDAEGYRTLLVQLGGAS